MNIRQCRGNSCLANRASPHRLLWGFHNSRTGAQGFRKAAANASRTFVELLSALDRKRGTGGQQKVTVEHVHVHSGGQAVVGNIAVAGRRGGGGAHEISEEPRAPDQLAPTPVLGAVLSPLRRADAERETVPVACDAERQVPNARRKQHRT